MRRYLWIYILVTIIVAIWGLRAIFNEPLLTQTARTVEYENKITASGYIVRDEVVYHAESAGAVEAAYRNESRVSKGKRIATIYTDGIDEQTKQALGTVNAKIRRLEEKNTDSALRGTDLSSAEEKISTVVSSVVEMAQTGNYEEADILQAELASYVHITEGGEPVNPTEEALDALYAQKRDLEASVQSGKQDVYSAMAGVFVSETDGYEDTLTPSAVEAMSVADFNSIKIENKPSVPETLNAGDRICKVVDNTQWYFATTVTERQLESVTLGAKVWLRFPELNSQRYAATVKQISEVSDGKAVVMVACSEYIQGIYTMRKVACEIITDLYDGFQIPPAAVRVDDEGNTGVYVDVSGIVRFRNIRILYQNDNIVIAAKSDENGYLKQYDAVIIGGKDIESGVVLK